MTAYWCEYAVVGTAEVRPGVLVEVRDRLISSVTPNSAPGSAERLAGLTIPGLANCHSHAFHRALRGRTQRGTGSFWAWREQMYALAGALDPDSYHRLARAVYREMAAAGITSVGEFHYLHHDRDGSPYADANVMGSALVAAAGDAGIRIALLDTCYLTAGFGKPPHGVQQRFSDGDADAWQTRAAALSAQAGRDVVIGAAAHSVRAVPEAALRVVAGWARSTGVPLHVHLSEQVAENDECHAAQGCTPTELLDAAGYWGELTTAVHATHLTRSDIGLLAQGGATACICPTTERDLGDGIGPARQLEQAGVAITLGSDSHAVIDPYEEMRALELDERLASSTRGNWSAAALFQAGTATGHASLGFPDAGQIRVGARADLVTLDLASMRTAGGGATLETAVFCAGSADVVQVVCEGRVIATRGGQAEVGRELAAAVDAVWQQA
ncbi:MAG: formimidoylglutamate deiminase [Nocardioidaceae bacterium]